MSDDQLGSQSRFILFRNPLNEQVYVVHRRARVLLILADEPLQH